MFIGFFVSAFSKSQRKNLLSTPKFLLFDTGVRNSAAGFIVCRCRRPMQIAEKVTAISWKDL
jgi:hypothetical protein